jgi:hypothetical protein
VHFGWNLITPGPAMETHQILRPCHSNLALTPTASETVIHIRYKQLQILIEIPTLFSLHVMLFNAQIVSDVPQFPFTNTRTITEIYDGIQMFFTIITRSDQY